MCEVPTVSDLMNCPSCSATLRLPEHAKVIRCPKCKLLLEVADETAEQEPLPPPPPVATSTKAIAKPIPKPIAQPAKKRVMRAAVVDEEAEAKAEVEAKAVEEAERKEQIRQELDEMDREKDKEDDRYEEIKDECHWGRNVLFLMMLGTYFYAGGMVFVLMGLLPLLMDVAIQAPIVLGYVGAGMGTLAYLAAFGIAFRGPKQGWFTAGLGIVASVLMMIFLGASLGETAEAIAKLGTGAFNFNDGYTNFKFLGSVQAPGTAFVPVADTPSRLLTQVMPAWFALLAGIFEFCRLIFVTQLTQRYAELAKAERTAAEPAKVISSLFWVVLLIAMFRVAAAFGFDRQPPKETAWWIGQIMHILLMILCFGMIALQLLKLAQTIRDTGDFFYAERVASKADRLDVV
jgi:LSD1 subclass zinc finger protein